MKDIDFDELDRAVSSVLGQDKPVQAETIATKAVIDNAPKKTDNEQSVKAVAEASSNAITINPRPKTTISRPVGPSLATARRGKFMDVMHQAVQTQAPSQKTVLEPVQKRESVTLEPSKELQESVGSSEAITVEKADLSQTVSTVEHTAEPTATFDESNALIGAEPALADTDLSEATTVNTEETEHVSDLQEEDEAAPHEVEEDLDTLTIEDTPVNSSLSSSLPQESPFLADTKVEKRPLGGQAETPDIDTDLANYGLNSTEKKDVQSAPVVPIPRELEADIVSVEAAQNEQDQTVSSSPFTANVAASAEPSDDGRVDGHPLFDTSTYHEPIAAVHRDGMPGWAKWLIGLMLCLAVGAGVGYFLFTAGL